MNINDYKPTNGSVTDVAVVYAYGSSSVNSSTAKNQITNTFINNNTNTTVNGINYKIYKYKAGSSGTVELTNKKRLQFVLTLRDDQATNSGAYSNVRAFVAFKCNNGTWKVSDNCVSYVNGKLQSQW